MNLTAWLADLAIRGVRFSVEDGRLHYRAPKGVLDAALLRQLSEQKAEIVALLTAPPAHETASVPAPVLPDPAGRYRPFPLTTLQLAFWAGRGAALELGRVGHHLYLEIEVIDLDVQRFHQALQRVIARHDMLRALILPDGQQQILEHVPALYASLHDLSDCDPQGTALGLESIRQAMEQQVLPVDRWPPYQIGVTRLPGRRSRVHLSLEALFLDMESVERLSEEFALLYAHPDVAQEPLAYSFRDYALCLEHLQQSSLYERSQAFWLARLATIPPAPDLPLAQSGAALEQARSVSLLGRLDPGDWARVQELAARMRLAPSDLLLTAFAEVLAASCHAQRLSISLINAQRWPWHPQVEELAGMFASMMVLTIERTEAGSFEELARQLHGQIVQEAQQWLYSGVHVLRELARERDEHARPLLPVTFAYPLISADSGQQLAQWPEIVCCTTRVPGVRLYHQAAERGGSLLLCWSVAERSFPAGWADALFAAYLRRLRQLAQGATGFTYEIESAGAAMQALEVSFGRASLREDLARRPVVPLAQSGAALPLQRYMQRVSYRVFQQAPIPLSQLSGLLALLRRIELDGLSKYLYPSAGGIYPVQVYLALKAGRVEGIEAGLYYYNPEAHQLVQLSNQDHVRRDLHGAVNQPVYESAAFSVFLVGQLRPVASVYGKAARDFCLLEAGAMSQLLMTEAPRYHLGLCPIGDMAFGALREALLLDEGHVVLHSLLGGAIDPALSTGWSFLP